MRNNIFYLLGCSVADPDPKNPHHFPGSGFVSKVGLDPECASVSNETDPDPTKPLKTETRIIFLPHLNDYSINRKVII